ncbi:MAG: DUF374 domain-containing protein [Chitinispirillia bacterium]
MKMDFLSRSINLLVNIIGNTWQYRVSGVVENSPYRSKKKIYCAWHENILPLSFYFRNSKASFIASYHKDGKRLSSILQHWGGAVIEGSSRRKGLTAIRESVREIKSGKSLVITPDGPRGPRRVVKGGIAQIAFLSQSPVILVHIRCKKSWNLHSWDRFIIPVPFTGITIEFSGLLIPETEGDTRSNSVNKLTTRIQKQFDEYSNVEIV